MQGGAAEAAGYNPSEETMQQFWEHCEDILGRAAGEVPEASLDADTQAQRLQHAKLEQVPRCFSFAVCHKNCRCFSPGGQKLYLRRSLQIVSCFAASLPMYKSTLGVVVVAESADNKCLHL